MNKTTKLFATLAITSVFSATLVTAEENKFKKYSVKSGKVFYEKKGSGNIMGMIKIKSIGKKRLIFNQYGANELTEINKIEKKQQEGKTTTHKTHKFTYSKKAITYHVDFKKKRIYRGKNQGLGMAMLFGGGKNMAETGGAMMEKMGGKKIGTDTIAGYKCTIWDLMGTKQCIYKGITLKTETNMMGMKNVEVATKAEFDIDTSNSFTLPDFPIYDRRAAGSANPAPLDKSTLEEMDRQANGEADKNAEEMQQAFAQMANAMKEAGIKKGQAPTEEQQQNMMTAMESRMFPRVKAGALKNEEVMLFGRDCLGSADTVKEANMCGKEAQRQFPGEPQERFDKWNPSIKKSVLKEINGYLDNSLPCIKKATTMSQFESCM